jgi:hypothetical protein
MSSHTCTSPPSRGGAVTACCALRLRVDPLTIRASAPARLGGCSSICIREPTYLLLGLSRRSSLSHLALAPMPLTMFSMVPDEVDPRAVRGKTFFFERVHRHNTEEGRRRKHLTEVVKVSDAFMVAMPGRALRVRLVLSITKSARRCDCSPRLGCQPDRSAPHPFPYRRKFGTARVPTSARLDILHPVATRCLPVQLRRPNRSFQRAASQYSAPSASI